jgi:broad specificity phosphatase PhoE
VLPARLILIRHGHIAGNSPSEARVNGWTDFPLSSLGRRQVEALRLRMASEPPAAVRYASPLQRAFETARALDGLPFGPLHPLDELKEIYCGEVDGWEVAELWRCHSQLCQALLRQEDDDLRWPGGESLREFRARCIAGVDRIAAAHPGERVLAVTHAWVITQILGVLQGHRPAVWQEHRPGNCSLTEIEWGNGGGRLFRFDDRAHLAGLPEEP